MRLFCRKAPLLLLCLFFACRDSTSPATIVRQFFLNDINGRALPTYMVQTPGLTPVIVSGSLALDNTGRAAMTEHRIEFDGVETTRTVNYKYTLIGRQLVFEQLGSCPGTAMCAGPPVGTISADGFGVGVDLYGSNTIVYNYRVLALE